MKDGKIVAQSIDMKAVKSWFKILQIKILLKLVLELGLRKHLKKYYKKHQLFM
jgi:hypothetical protein